jgi:hypothetical protein
MAKKKKYAKVKGTKDFLILTILCAVLGIWAVRDGWFPSNKTLKKHPHALTLGFDAGGVVLHVEVREGEAVGEGVVLAKLATGTLDQKLKALEVDYAIARDSGKEQLAAEAHAEILTLRDQILASTLKIAKGYMIELDENRVPQIVGAVWDENDPNYKKCYLLKEKSMVIQEVLIKSGRRIDSGEPAIVVNTKDHFYPFNKVLALVSGIGMAVFGILHILASKD